MSKKISKTIMSLIVFVVFLGIGIFAGVGNVFAYNNYSTTCVYGFEGSDNIKFALHINHDGGLTEYALIEDSVISDWDKASFGEKWTGFWEYALKNTDTLQFENWGPKFEGFSGSEYFVNHEENGKRKCPPVAIYGEFPDEHYMILSDGSKEHYYDVESFFVSEETSELDTSSIGSFLTSGVEIVQDYFNYTVIDYYGGASVHIIDSYVLLKQYYYDEPDPKNEEVIDDGTVREWVNPKIKTVTPLEEDDYNYSCGNGMITGIPSRLPKFGKFLYNFLQFLVPIVLVLMGTIDLVKATTGGKEDDIKKNQMIFVKRLISAVLIFFSFAIIKLVLSVVAEESAPIIECTDCIIRHSSNCIVEIK